MTGPLPLTYLVGKRRIMFIPLALAEPKEVEAAVDSVSDSFKDWTGTRENWLRRHHELHCGENLDYSGISIIQDGFGFAGWCGWLPYQEEPDIWQSSTYLAPRLRGLDAIPVMRCHQVHRAEVLAERLGRRDIRFISSIDVANTRSLKASKRYALDAGWGGDADWVLTEEKNRGRNAYVLAWPEMPATHACFSGAAG